MGWWKSFCEEMDKPCMEIDIKWFKVEDAPEKQIKNIGKKQKQIDAEYKLLQ